MLYDRTIKDVNEAISIVDEKIKNQGNSEPQLSNSDIAILERGMVTYNTLNRIENKQAQIKEWLNNAGYFDTSEVVNKEWTIQGVFLDDDLNRIVENNKNLRRAFFALKTTPMDAIPKFHYEEFNALEKILVDLEAVIVEMVNNYKECDTIDCGEG